MRAAHITSVKAPQSSASLAAAPDAELAERAASGDEMAFETIMRRHNRLLFRTAHSILRSDAEAEDALQEAYMRVWRAVPTFRSDSTLATWMVRIIINEAPGRLRRHCAQAIPLHTAMESTDLATQESMHDDPDRRQEQAAMWAQMRQLMEARIDALPAAFRTVFMLRTVQEMSVQEVSAALEIPEATVRTRYFRARGLLREGLARDIDLAIGDAFAFAGGRCDRVVAAVLVRFSQEHDIPRS